ncbi:TPA: DNA-binding protein, partial [Acinetobacter baumannii]|nr:DNA-binding protein [Acinetobacter baumannii]
MTEETANKRRYPSASAWAEAEALWASGDVTLEDLAKKVGVSATSVSLHMKKRKITKGEKAKEHS